MSIKEKNYDHKFKIKQFNLIFHLILLNIWKLININNKYNQCLIIHFLYRTHNPLALQFLWIFKSPDSAALNLANNSCNYSVGISFFSKLATGTFVILANSCLAYSTLGS
jgi:hypothetical protein